VLMSGVGIPVDSIGQLQAKILEVSHLMLSAFGVAQGDAAPVRFSSKSALASLGQDGGAPLSVEAEKIGVWEQSCAAQKSQRAEYAKLLVAACLDIDRLAEVLPERREPDVNRIEKLQKELRDAENAVNEALVRSQKVVKQLRDAKEEALEALVLKSSKRAREGTDVWSDFSLFHVAQTWRIEFSMA
jgi:hypothetical protein